MITIGDCSVLDWEQDPYSSRWSRPIVKSNRVYTKDPDICGRIWVRETAKKEWLAHMIEYYGAGQVVDIMKHYTSPRFSIMQEAQDNVDRFLLRMQRMISFL